MNILGNHLFQCTVICHTNGKCRLSFCAGLCQGTSNHCNLLTCKTDYMYIDLSVHVVGPLNSRDNSLYTGKC